MTDDHPDPDDLPALVSALQRRCAVLAGENQELRERVTDLEDTVATLEQRAPDPSKMAYDQMDREDKIAVVCSKLAEAARNRSRESYRWHYDQVMDALDGHPSPGHTYDLMEWAGQVDGFEYGETPDGTKRLTVELEGVNEDAGFIPANKATERVTA